ncbi:MAG: (E)-4-hydroxy-3-methylbut-2-enyl-diphosphate synthase [Candidatus Omnitrophota bacterium]|jgi:(E)-4-hydroxy-3-methylbut-2-enyl-diphosphate synthase
MRQNKRRQTPTIHIGNVPVGSEHPVVIQSMTDTPTADQDKTYAQTVSLIEAGSQLVRWTVNNDDAARAVPEIINKLRNEGYNTPIIGDFHFNGHTLLTKHPDCAQMLSKYRINPGNVGRGNKHDSNFTDIVKVAIDNNKPVRIGVNWGSLDQELLTSLMDANAKAKNPRDYKEVTYDAMIQSALTSAQLAEKQGLGKDKIILSVKMSILQDMVTAYSMLAEKCDYALHLGLTEAGAQIQGISSSSAALGILLQQGIGDTIRVSLTPQPDIERSREVEVCKHILQSMGLRYFKPSVTSCPGCGRTSSTYFQILAKDINEHIERMMPTWKKKHPGVEKMKIAVMGCVVNGPGESKHADIGISLPGDSEEPIAPVYQDGEKLTVLKGDHIKEEFTQLLEHYIKSKFNTV